MERTEKTIILIFAIWCLACVYVLQNVNVNVAQNSVYEIAVMLFVAFLLGYFFRNEISQIDNTKKELPVVKSELSILPLRNDLKIIEGIGPAIEKILNSNGIQTYKDLSDASVEALKAILKKAGPIYENHGEENWGEQAALLRDGKMVEFKKLTEELVGGHRVS